MIKRYFGTDGIRSRVGSGAINPEFVLKLGWAAGRVLGGGAGGRVLIGKDTRISGYMLESALEAGLSAAGVDIHLLGPMPTPAIAYLTRTFRANAGIVISASHNPYHDNGIKFFSGEGLKLPDEVELAIESELNKPMVTVDSDKLGRATRINDASGRYIEFCKRSLPTEIRLTGIKLVVDCAHGATYHIAPNVFRELGAEVVELGVDPDGLNINANCGSTKLDVLRQIVLVEKADLGIAFDGDGDRVLMVDETGNSVDGDELLFIIAKALQTKGELSGGVVGTVLSNFGLEKSLASLDIDFIRTQVGDRYILAELNKRNWFLGGEASGHLLNLQYNTTGDGIISALQVLKIMFERKVSLSTLRQEMSKVPQQTFNVKMLKRIELAESPALQQAVSETQAALGKRGRVILRPSGTEPLMRIMLEGPDPKELKQLGSVLAEKVRLILTQEKISIN